MTPAPVLPDADDDARAPRLVPLTDAPLFSHKVVRVDRRKLYRLKVFLFDGSSEVGFPTLLALETDEEAIFRRWGHGRYRVRLVSVTPDDTVEPTGYDTTGGSVNIKRGEWPAPPMDGDQVPDLTAPEAADGIGSEIWPVDPARLSPDAAYEYARRRAIFDVQRARRDEALKRARAAATRGAQSGGAWLPVDDGAPHEAPREEPSIERVILLKLLDGVLGGGKSAPDPLAHERALAEIRRQERDDEWRRAEAKASAEHARQLEVLAAQARAAGASVAPPRVKSEAEIRAEVLLEQHRAAKDPRETAQVEIDRAVAFARSLGYQRPAAAKGSDDDDVNFLGPIMTLMQSPLGDALAKRLLGSDPTTSAATAAAALTAGATP